MRNLCEAIAGSQDGMRELHRHAEGFVVWEPRQFRDGMLFLAHATEHVPRRESDLEVRVVDEMDRRCQIQRDHHVLHEFSRREDGKHSLEGIGVALVEGVLRIRPLVESGERKCFC